MNVKENENKIRNFFSEIKPNIETTYNEWRKKQLLTDDERLAQRGYRFEDMPVVSIVVPAYKTPRDFLIQMIESVIEQTYANWELCIADASTDDSIRDILEEYHEKDVRIKYTLLEENLGISDNTNKALEIATGDYIALLDHDDVIEEDALYEVVKCINDEKVKVVYTDEDKVSMDLNKFFEPNFKPDYNRELLLNCNYITHFFVVKKEIVDQIGFLDDAYDGSQDYDFILRATGVVDKVGHVRKVLYHWRCHEASTAMNPEAKLYCYEAGRKAIQRALDNDSIRGKAYRRDILGCYGVEYVLEDHLSVLVVVINGTIFNSNYENEEVLYLKDVNDIKVYEQISDSIRGKERDYVFIVQGNGELKDHGMETLLANIQRKGIGMVGCKVVSADEKIVEAGRVVSRREKLQNVCVGLEQDNAGYQMRALLQQEVGAYGFNGILLSTDDFNDYVENVADKEAISLSRHIGEHKKIVYCPDAIYKMDDNIYNIRMNSIDLPEGQREDKFYSNVFAKKGAPYALMWDKSMGVKPLIAGYLKRLHNKKSFVYLIATLIISMCIGIGMMWPSLKVQYLSARDDDLIDTIYLDSSTVCHSATMDDDGNLILGGMDCYFEINNIQHSGKTVAIKLNEPINQGEVIVKVSVDYGEGYVDERISGLWEQIAVVDSKIEASQDEAETNYLAEEREQYASQINELESQKIETSTLRGAEYIVVSVPSDSYTDLRIRPNANLSIASVEFHSQDYVLINKNYPNTSLRIIIGIVGGFLLWMIFAFAEVVFRRGEKYYAWVKKSYKAIITYAVGMGIAAALSFVINGIVGGGLQGYVFFAMMICSIIVIGRYVLVDQCGIEETFALLLLIAGTAMILCSPLVPHSWDVAAHQFASLQASGIKGSVGLTEADWVIMQSGVDTSSSFVEGICTLNDMGRYISSTIGADPKLYRLPAGVAIALARLFRLPFFWRYNAGRFGQLLIYCLCGYIGMRRLHSGKMIYATIMAMPVCVFLAANYSYDYWVIAFTMVGMAYFVGMSQEKDAVVSYKETIIMCTAFAIGCEPKSIYMPLLLFPLMMSKKKLKNRRIPYYIICIGVMVMTLAIFAIVSFSNITGGGDTRGGAVDPVAQLNNIAMNFTWYLGVLSNYLKTLINPFVIKTGTFLAYLGTGPGYLLIVLILAVVTLTDKNNSDKRAFSEIVRAYGIVFFVGELMMIATALYLVFSPVGSTDMGGCQPRYMIPLFYPLCAVICGGGIRVGFIPQKIYRCAVLVGLLGVTYMDIYVLMVAGTK